MHARDMKTATVSEALRGIRQVKYGGECGQDSEADDAAADLMHLSQHGSKRSER